MEWLVFVPLAAMALVTAALVIVLRNPVYCALSLVGTFLALSGIYLLLQAQFIAVVQVIVYAGAIMVLFLFVVMLLDLGHELPAWLQRDRSRFLLGVGAAALLLLELAIPIGSNDSRAPQGPYTSEVVGAIGNAQLVGRLLFTDFLIPFEITSVILLIAIIGAMVLARR
ncbi:MAG: NADH-quinone oxidoreductase subunit J [Candidatus Methylomirabilis oxygeniifera]|uniref:NADH-quinone oxidoreductase subunit J n=2 Tax=Candidatus Methylomirabilis TaxID=1170227 RepID=D5MKE5_METO1|nr:MAG: NADH-quinone oxidoreductase subunit J [Candidatus Methylomirabilis oxyfera]CBE69767.1 NADH-quinone oxidoreductase chain J (NADH dehydrogenase I, chain J) (NDH-1, chain J) [Candidatus Methylomirabilis oxyfera]